VHQLVISQRLTGRKRGSVAGLRRSASAVWIHLIIPEAEINREHKNPEQGKKRNHRQIAGALMVDLHQL
tara:strand:- start:1319 stop:1525 length:207 start_codon:yes stop_codon:yes gene_type:complete